MSHIPAPESIRAVQHVAISAVAHKWAWAKACLNAPLLVLHDQLKDVCCSPDLSSTPSKP